MAGLDDSGRPSDLTAAPRFRAFLLPSCVCYDALALMVSFILKFRGHFGSKLLYSKRLPNIVIFSVVFLARKTAPAASTCAA